MSKPTPLHELRISDWDKLSQTDRERLFLRLEPSDAYQWLVDAREERDHYKRLLDDAGAIAKQAIAGWEAALAGLNQRGEEYLALRLRLDAIDRSRGALDQQSATAANAARAKETDRLIRDHVRRRIRQNPLLTAKQLTREIAAESWAVKNYKREPFSFASLQRKVGPLVTEAKEDFRKGTL